MVMQSREAQRTNRKTREYKQVTNFAGKRPA
jgi:hypothetical protein